MRNIEITPQKNSANDGDDFERVDIFSYENESLDAFLLESSGSTDNLGIDKLLVEVDRTDVGRKLI